MALPPLLSLRDVRLTFGGTPLFQGVTTWIGRGDRTCLVGRNGSGKSTLLKVFSGAVLSDQGERFVHPGTRIGLLPQEPDLVGDTVAEAVRIGLPEDEREQTHRVDAIMAALGLEGEGGLDTLSGGEARRATLARTLVALPDVLLLDEPTNHLDLPTILWLEQWLQNSYRGALVTISHDRRFLETVSRQTLWLDRGVVRRAEVGFSAFPAWQEETVAAEEAELDRMQTRLRQENHWLARGVTARRKRNMGRLRALLTLREERAERLTSRQEAERQVKLTAEAGESSGQQVIEAVGISKSFGDKVIVRDFSTRILRGDRIGLIGPNGAGKTTLLRLLIGEEPPDDGTVRLGTNLESRTFDQRRTQLDPEMSVWDTLTDGRGDSVWVNGQQRHVVGYMKDFLFSEAQARTPVRALSGGERNRLLLAKLLAKPGNLLVLDEPTNDLDMETLDLLEEVLADYEGTLLLVSHDRDFLDRLVSSVIALEGEGRVHEYVGGYSDYDRQRPKPVAETPPPSAVKPTVPTAAKVATKLSYKENRELEGLPGAIETLNREITTLQSVLDDQGLYAKDRARFDKTAKRLDEARAELEAAEDRWLELEELRQDLANR